MASTHQAGALERPLPSGYHGVLAASHRLAGLRLISLGGESGPEHVALGPDQRVYAAVASGNILRMTPEGNTLGVYASTGGRVLGFDFDAAGNPVAADAYCGLLSISPKREVTALVNQIRWRASRYATLTPCGGGAQRENLLHRRLHPLRRA